MGRGERGIEFLIVGLLGGGERGARGGNSPPLPPVLSGLFMEGNITLAPLPPPPRIHPR